MRIGIEAQRIFRAKKHGMDIVALELIKALQSMQLPHDFFVFVQDGPDRNCLEESANFKIVVLPSSPYPVWEQWHLPRAANKLQLALLHCTSNTAPLFLNIPLVLTLHDIIYLEGINYRQGTNYQKFGNIYRRLIVPKIVKKAKAILTVSNFERQTILSYFSMSAQLVRTAYNGVAGHFKQALDPLVLASTKETYQLPDRYIFYLGNTDPKKNVLGVLQALILLNKKGKLPCKLLMLDIDKDFLFALISQLGDPYVLDHICFVGYVPNKDLPAIYAQADLFLYPSLRESFGIPLLEAMACGVPIVTSNTSSMPEIVGDAAVLCDPYSAESIAAAIEKLMADVALQNELRLKGKERVQQFSWLKNAEQTLKVYEDVFSLNTSANL